MSLNQNDAPAGYAAVPFTRCADCAMIRDGRCSLLKLRPHDTQGFLASAVPCTSPNRADGQDVMFVKRHPYASPAEVWLAITPNHVVLRASTRAELTALIVEHKQ